MKLLLSIFFCLLFLLIKSVPVYPQDKYTLQVPEAFNENLLWFDSIIGTENSGLVNGKIDFHIFRRSNGHRFFEVDEWQTGLIKYDGQVYALSGVKYDVVNQNIVVKYLDQQYKLPVPLQIHSEKVDWFKVSDHFFQKIPFVDESLNESVKGFYNILYRGDNLVFISKRKKELIETLVNKTVVPEYPLKDQYFILRNDEIIKINRKKDYYQLVPHKKQEIKQFVRKNSLRINRENEEALIMLAKFCESLVN